MPQRSPTASSVIAAAVAILQRAQHALDELGPRVRVREALARAHDVRLDQRAAARAQVELLQPFAHDRADALRRRSCRSGG